MGEEEGDTEFVGFKEDRPHWRAEFVELLKLAGPIALSYFASLAPNLITIIFVGQMCDKLSMDATALGTMFGNVTALSIGYGLASGLDTLCSQAHGAGKTKLIGVYLQRAGVLLMLSMIPMILVNVFAAEILQHAFGQSPAVSAAAGLFCRWNFISLPFSFAFSVVADALTSQSIVAPNVYINWFAAGLHALMCWVLIGHFKIGYLGAAYARIISAGVQPLLLMSYIWWKSLHKSFWGGWTTQAFKEIGAFLKLSIPGLLMLCSDWWAFEILGVLAGLLANSQDALGAHAVAFNTSALTYMIFLGIGDSINVRVGNFVGASQPINARTSMVCGYVMNSIMGIICAALLFGLRRYVGMAFTTNAAILALVDTLLIPVAAYQIFDGINGANGGAFRGVGRQTRGALLNGLGYYIFGIPIAATLAFCTDLGVTGLWLGITAGLCISATSGVLNTSRINWVKMVKEANDRMEAEEKHGKETGDAEEARALLDPDPVPGDLKLPGPVSSINTVTSVWDGERLLTQ